IITAAGSPAAIGTHLERLHGPLMGFACQAALPALHFPPPQPAVTASTDQPPAIRPPGHSRDDPSLLRQDPYRLSALGIPHHQFPVASQPLAATGTDQPPAIAAEGHAALP